MALENRSLRRAPVIPDVSSISFPLTFGNRAWCLYGDVRSTREKALPKHLDNDIYKKKRKINKRNSRRDASWLLVVNCVMFLQVRRCASDAATTACVSRQAVAAL